MGDTSVCHYRLNVGKVHIDERKVGDQVGDALHALSQHIVGHAGRLPASTCFFRSFAASLSLGTTTRESTYFFRKPDAQFWPAFFSWRLQKRNGFVTTPTVSIPISLRCLGYDGSRACSRSAAHTGGYENHIGAVYDEQIISSRVSSAARLSDLRISSGAKPPGQLFAYLYLSSLPDICSKPVYLY